MISINKFLIFSFIIILLPKVSFGNTNDYELYEVKNYHDQFCSKLVSNITNKNIEDEWIVTEKNKNYQLLINNNTAIQSVLYDTAFFIVIKLKLLENNSSTQATAKFSKLLE